MDSHEQLFGSRAYTVPPLAIVFDSGLCHIGTGYSGNRRYLRTCEPAGLAEAIFDLQQQLEIEHVQREAERYDDLKFLEGALPEDLKIEGLEL